MDYLQLFTQLVPRPIKCAEEKARLMAEVDRLMDIPEEQLTQDQADMLELLAILVQDYEKKITAALKAFQHTKENYHNTFKELADS